MSHEFFKINNNEYYSLDNILRPCHTVSIGINFLSVIQNIQNLQISQGYIFHILQHFTTKLCNFTKFKMLVNAVVMNFAISKFFKILSLCNRSFFMQLATQSHTQEMLISEVCLAKCNEDVYLPSFHL